MKPLRTALIKATWLGGIAALLTFMAIYFTDDFQQWRYHPQRLSIIVCPEPDNTNQAAAWAFVAYAAVFTLTLLASSGRTRKGVFRKQSQHWHFLMV